MLNGKMRPLIILVHLADFLVAFRQVRTADASTLQTFRVDSAINSVGTIERNYVLPSRVVHPRFETRRNGKARYVLCHRASIEQLAGKGELGLI